MEEWNIVTNTKSYNALEWKVDQCTKILTFVYYISSLVIVNLLLSCFFNCSKYLHIVNKQWVEWQINCYSSDEILNWILRQQISQSMKYFKDFK